MMCRLIPKHLLLVIFAFPLVAGAQLSSENFVVEGPTVSALGFSNTATSTNYELQLESGGLYIYDTPSNGRTTSSARPRATTIATTSAPSATSPSRPVPATSTAQQPRTPQVTNVPRAYPVVTPASATSTAVATPVTEPEVRYGVTPACNRAFVWDDEVSVSVFRKSRNQTAFTKIATTPATMPWFVDISDSTRYSVIYQLQFPQGVRVEVVFTADDFSDCVPDPASVIGMDVDNNGDTEQFIEGIFQDLDGSSRPLAMSSEGVVLDTNGDSLADLFWNPTQGVSPVVLSAIDLQVTDQSIVSSYLYQPLAEVGYRVSLTSLGNKNVSLAPVSATLIALATVTTPVSEVSPSSHWVGLDVLGVGSGLTLVWYALTKIPFSVFTIGRLFAHGWANLFGLVAFWKRRRPWGTVYDSVTKAPVDPAFVEIFDTSGVKHGEAITDLDGRYGFLVPAGEYTLRVKKTNYLFPSQALATSRSESFYSNLYFGGPVAVDATAVYDIPMDAERFDWNQYEKMRTKQTHFISWIDPIISQVLQLVFYAGAIAIVWQFYKLQDVYSLVLLLVYAVLLLLRLTRGKPVLYGVLRAGKVPLAFAVIKIKQHDRLVMKRVADAKGRYVAIVPKGTYSIEIAAWQGKPDEYKVVYTGEITARKGVINQNLSL